MPTIQKINRSIGTKQKPQPRSKTETREVHDSSLWRNKIRPTFLNANPLCVHCEKEGVIREANEVDHIKPISEGGAKYDIRNLQSLCKYHHSVKTARENHKEK